MQMLIMTNNRQPQWETAKDKLSHAVIASVLCAKPKFTLPYHMYSKRTKLILRMSQDIRL